MPSFKTTLRQYCVVTITYFLLVVLLPANRVALHDYNLTSLSYHLLLLSIVLPLALIWFGGFYSYARLQQYRASIVDSPEASDFGHMTRGFIWLAWGPPLIAIGTIVLNTVADSHPPFRTAAVITANYASMLIILIALSAISTGTRNLNQRNKIVISSRGARSLILFFMIVGVAYCVISFRHLDLHSLASTNNPYYMPVWLVISTIVIPSMYTWFIGLLAAYEIYLYSRSVTGLLYRRAMRLVSFGVISVIASSIVVQYFHAIVPRRGHLSLSVIIIIVNIIYILMASGYIMLSLGASQLRKIEEV